MEPAGLRCGFLICADVGYTAPARILALRGARVIFAPHFNTIAAARLIPHFMKVRADHTARAIENSVYFVRGNNVVLDPAKTGIHRQPEPVGYGDSYVIDPNGEILVRSRRHVEDFMVAEVDPNHPAEMAWGQPKSAWSFREFHTLVEAALASQRPDDAPRP